MTSMRRREFITGVGALAAISSLKSASLLVRDGAPVSAGKAAAIHLGYAAITWDGNDRQAIHDISKLGFHGIQVRSNCIAEFGSPQALRTLLDQNQLKMVALSSGDLSIDPALESQELARHVANAHFLRDAGGLYLQIIDKKPPNREVVTADYKRLGALLTSLGKRTADLGIPLGYHNHMGAMGEHPEGVEQIMQAADPRYVKLELDIAHYFAGGGDPAKAIEQYRDRLLFLHIKDVELVPGGAEGQDYRFVELGRGSVDIPSVFAALRRTDFQGWGIIELDGPPNTAQTAAHSAAVNKLYVTEKLGLTL